MQDSAISLNSLSQPRIKVNEKIPCSRDQNYNVGDEHTSRDLCKKEAGRLPNCEMNTVLIRTVPDSSKERKKMEFRVVVAFNFFFFFKISLFYIDERNLY